MRKTTIAMIRKSIIFPRKLPTINTIGPSDNVASLHAPPGMKKVMMGISISETREDTSFPEAPPIITATASPMTPYFVKNALNSAMNPFGAGGDCGAGLGSTDSLITFTCSINFSNESSDIILNNICGI